MTLQLLAKLPTTAVLKFNLEEKMKKGIITLAALLFLPLAMAIAQEKDPVVMKIAGKNIGRTEFEYFFNKNNDSKNKTGKAVEDYVDLFVNYKLKVLAAEDAHLDTLSSFIKEFRTYRDMQLRPYVSDPIYEDSVAKSVYDTYKNEVGDSDLLHVAHIMMILPQRSSDVMKAEKKERIDSAYQALQGGANFAELAKKCSEDYTTAPNGGDLPWIGPKQTLPEFEKVAYSLKPGEYSKPFLSSVGYHIIYMKERKKLEPYTEKKAEIMKMLESRGIKDTGAEHKIKQMVDASNGKLTREDIMANIEKEAGESDPNLQYLIEEYHDGLLLYEASNRFVWKKAADDKTGLEKYFKKNKGKYKWDSPRFRGFIILAKSQKMVHEAQNFLKKYKSEEGIEAFNKILPKDSLRNIRIRFGVFKEGEDAHVDEYIFKKESSKTQNKFYPYDGVSGMLLSKPKIFEDVKAQLISDYQDEKEEEWVVGLRKKYPFSVNKEVLQTVNNHSAQ